MYRPVAKVVRTANSRQSNRDEISRNLYRIIPTNRLQAADRVTDLVSNVEGTQMIDPSAWCV